MRFLRLCFLQLLVLQLVFSSWVQIPRAWADDGPASLTASMKAAQSEIVLPSTGVASGALNLTVQPTGKASDTSRAPVDVVLVVDKSGSMNDDTDSSYWVTKTKMTLAKSAVGEAINLFKSVNSGTSNIGDRLAMVPFGSEIMPDSNSQYTLTSNTNNAFDRIKSLVDALSPDGGTNYYDALDKAISILDGSTRSKYIIFLTDGQPTFTKRSEYVSSVSGYDTEPFTGQRMTPPSLKNTTLTMYYGLWGSSGKKYFIYNNKKYGDSISGSIVNQKIGEDIASLPKTLASKGIKVYSIGFGSSDDVDLDLLDNISRPTGGTTTQGRADNLNAIFRSISDDINSLAMRNVKIKVPLGQFSDKVKVKSGTNVITEGNTVILNYNDVPFTVGGATPGPQTIQLPLDFSQAGQYNFSGVQLEYTDFSGKTVTKTVEPTTINVVSQVSPTFDVTIRYVDESNQDKNVSELTKSVDASKNNDSFTILYTLTPRKPAGLTTMGTGELSAITLNQQLPKGLTVKNSNGTTIKNTANNDGSMVTMTFNKVTYSGSNFTSSSPQTIAVQVQVDWALRQQLLSPELTYVDNGKAKSISVAPLTDTIRSKVLLPDSSRGFTYEGNEAGQLTKVKNDDNTAVDSVLLMQDDMPITFPVKAMNFVTGDNTKLDITYRDVENNADIHHILSMAPSVEMKEKQSQKTLAANSVTSDNVVVSLNDLVPDSGGKVGYSYQLTKGTQAMGWKSLSTPYRFELNEDGVYKIEVKASGGFAVDQTATSFVTIKKGEVFAFDLARTVNKSTVKINEPATITYTIVPRSISADAFANTPPTEMSGVRPFFLIDQNFTSGGSIDFETELNKIESKGNSNGGGLSLGGNGWSNFSANMQKGYSGKVYAGKEYPTEPSAKVDKIIDELKNLIQKGTTRITIPLVAENKLLKGKDTVEISGFATFDLSLSNGKVKGTYRTTSGESPETVVVSDLTYSEILPKDIQLVSLKPSNLIGSVENGRYTVHLPSLTYQKNGDVYEAAPVSLTLEVKSGKAGTYLFDDAKLSYTEQNGDKITKDFPDMTLTVNQTLPDGVSITPDHARIKVGETIELHATVSPADAEQTVNWTSSDSDVASVDNGVVTGNQAGTAIITASTPDGKFKATSTITVYVPVTGVVLDKDSLTLNLDDQKETQLHATVLPKDATNQKVTWSTSNANVATVDQNGNVTAVGGGVATITVTTEEGGYTDTCQVTVQTRPEITVTANNGWNASYTEKAVITVKVVYYPDAWPNNLDFRVNDRQLARSEITGPTFGNDLADGRKQAFYSFDVNAVVKNDKNEVEQVLLVGPTTISARVIDRYQMASDLITNGLYFHPETAFEVNAERVGSGLKATGKVTAIPTTLVMDDVKYAWLANPPATLSVNSAWVPFNSGNIATDIPLNPVGTTKVAIAMKQDFDRNGQYTEKNEFAVQIVEIGEIRPDFMLTEKYRFGNSVKVEVIPVKDTIDETTRWFYSDTAADDWKEFTVDLSNSDRGEFMADYQKDGNGNLTDTVVKVKAVTPLNGNLEQGAATVKTIVLKAPSPDTSEGDKGDGGTIPDYNPTLKISTTDDSKDLENRAKKLIVEYQVPNTTDLKVVNAFYSVGGVKFDLLNPDFTHRYQNQAIKLIKTPDGKSQTYQVKVQITVNVYDSITGKLLDTKIFEKDDTIQVKAKNNLK